jgi:hypothetical protein
LEGRGLLSCLQFARLAGIGKERALLRPVLGDCTAIGG